MCVLNQSIKISYNDDIRSQKLDKFKMYPYGTNAFIVCKIKMLDKT